MKRVFTFFVMFLIAEVFSLQAKEGVIRIVVLGSSTAAGTGPQNPANAWVNQYTQYVKSVNSASDVINLAVGGYTTYHVMPSDFTPPTDRPSPNTERNITKALSYSPDVIIINLPTNDANANYTVTEQLNNYKVILAKATEKNVPVFITTTQPRNFSADQRQNLIAMRDSTIKKWGTKAIDFWTEIANADGTINTKYDMGDGVHLNDAAHTVLKDRVVKSSVLTHSRSDNDKDTINIDFGTTISTGNWNNLKKAPQDTILNLINTQKQNTGIAVWIHDAFTGVNTTGTTTPDASVQMPESATSDSFFGSEGAHNGITEPTGGITLSGLNRNSKYSFTFFASRVGVTDNRETKYKVSGKTDQTATLNPSNNTANTVTISDVFPAANGTIIITVSPGPNNNNSLKYYFLGAIRMTSEKQPVVYDRDGTIHVDFGNKLSTGNWNNLTIPTGGEVISDLVNTEGNSTGFSLWVHDAFTGINNVGTTSPDASLDMSVNATSDSFFGSEGAHSGITEPTGGITLGGLNADTKFTFSFFASRDQVTDNREAKYKVTGLTEEIVYLDASNNKKNIAKVPDIRPAQNGTIKIEVAPGPNNNNSLKYYYLGAMRIEYSTVPTSAKTELTMPASEMPVSVFPNPTADKVTFSCILPEAGDLQIQVYNIRGQLEQVISRAHCSAGQCTIKWDGITSQGAKLDAGVHFCRISLNGAGKTYSNTQKLLVK